MSTPTKHVAHFLPNPEAVLYSPSVFLCQPNNPYNPNVDNTIGKTMVLHPLVTLISGTQGQPGAVYQCAYCRTKVSSA